MIIRDALRELDMWGAGAVFQLTEYEDSHKVKLMIIKDWKELVAQVSKSDTNGSTGIKALRITRNCCIE